MKHPLSFYLALAIMPALISLTGCAKQTGADRAASTATRMESVESASRETVMKISAAQGAMDQLLESGQEEVQKNFEEYTRAVNDLDQTGSSLLRHMEAMNKQGADYFEEWAKQGEDFQNPRIQALSAERRAELREIYGQTARTSAGIEPRLSAFIRNNREIQGYLSNDLTPNSLDAIAQEARRVSRNGSGIINSLNTMIASLNRAQAAFAQGGKEGSAAGGERFD